MRGADLIAFNHFAEFPARHDIGDATVFFDAADNTLATSLPISLNSNNGKENKTKKGEARKKREIRQAGCQKLCAAASKNRCSRQCRVPGWKLGE